MTSDVYMTLSSHLSNIISSLDPTYSAFVNSKGEIVVKLDKALYGCVESARLSYNEMNSYLQSLGFQRSEVDSCVYFKHENEMA
jgi:hypothetical protein